MIDVFALLKLLWRDVVKGPNDRPRLGQLLGAGIFEQTKVTDLPQDAVFLMLQEDVVGLDVPVDIAPAMDFAEAIEEREEVGLDLSQRVAVSLQLLGIELAAIAPLLNAANQALIFDEVEDSDDVWVVELVLEPRLSQKALAKVFFLGILALQHLQRHMTLQDPMAGFVHVRHSTFADHGFYVVILLEGEAYELAGICGQWRTLHGVGGGL